MALHKDPTDPTKLRPISMGSALRRIAGKYIMEAYTPDIASHLIPTGQFGISTQGGLQYLIDYTRSQLHRYLDKGDTPRVLLLLDLLNMFNQVSRQAIRDHLHNHPIFRSLLPLFDLFYGQANLCFYRDAHGNLKHFTQEEGVAQGCPLGPFLAALCLSILLTDLAPHLHHRALTRKEQGALGDDGRGTHSALASYLDDTSGVVSPLDIPFILNFFVTKGPPLGLFLNFSKTKILTTTTGSPTQHPAIVEALTYIQQQAGAATNPELTSGTRFLGVPIGSRDFANQFLSEAADTYATHLTKLQESLEDRHTISLLFKSCAQPSLQHLLASDIYYNYPHTHSPDLDSWTSPFIAATTAANHSLLAFLGNTTTPLPEHSLAIAFHPVSHGGQGFRDHSKSAKTAFVVAITRSLRYATHGVPVGDTTVTLPHPLSSPLASWSTTSTDNPTFTIYKALAPLLFALPAYIWSHGNPPQDTNQFVSTHTSLTGLASRIYSHHCTKSMDTLLPTFPAEVRQAFPNILSHTTSLPLFTYNRRHPHNRLSNDTFLVMFQRKLRLPVLPPQQWSLPCPHKSCKQTLDKYGDHLFSCKFAKHTLHNNIRDTLFLLCSTAAPMAGFVHSKHSVTCETGGLLPQYPNKRPADVGLHLKSTAFSGSAPQSANFLAIDVTVTGCPTASDVSPNLNPFSKIHMNAVKGKLQSARPQTISNPAYFRALHQQGIILLPFTVDPFGGLGYFASRFLYGPTTTHESPDPEPPPQSFKPPTHSQDNYQLLLDHLHSLLPKATKHYNPPTHTSHTAQPLSPLRWAHHCLALNLTTQLANHIHRGLASVHTSIHTPGTSPDSVLGFAFSQSQPTQLLDPLPGFLLGVAPSQ